jgi:uncharacterized protein (DUF924 family)
MSVRKGPHAQAAEDRRVAAEAAALRANLRKRKLQARGREALADEAAVNGVLEFWFGAEPGAFRQAWFERSDAFDAECRDRFAATCAQAAAGELDRWGATPEGALALVLLLDQFPRNIHRGTPSAFATDAKALDLARRMVARGFDRALEPVARFFVYLPFEHAEDLGAQDEAVRLVEGLPDAPWRDNVLKYARAHRDVIARFGRFPHRNAVLGRRSTEAEAAYLAEPGAGF